MLLKYRKFDSGIPRKVLAGLIKPAFFLSIFIYIHAAICGYLRYNKVLEVFAKKFTVSKSKNSTSFYVQKTIRKSNGNITTVTVKKLGNLTEVTAKAAGKNPYV